MMLREKIAQDARAFLKGVDERRDGENAKMFRAGGPEIKESVIVIPPRRIESEPAPIKEVLFSPNSNAQGV